MTAKQCLNHTWLRVSVTPTPPPVPGLDESKLFEKGKKKKKNEQSLDKKRLKKFVIRRRWQKAVNAILALKRMGALFYK
ncbi:unnamed protein product [Oppiella nova]|uniref:Uncharacterized protein n=1 Tax=Oppiella nova TaxID=334625 RepID=A0A7R9LY93_9ACAR|nr:unnamed protein product [Oppiella nova]CAG2168138.1 unnamed protein product [Oppiella nova]